MKFLAKILKPSSLAGVAAVSLAVPELIASISHAAAAVVAAVAGIGAVIGKISEPKIPPDLNAR